MAKLVYIRQIAVYDDGTETELRFQPYEAVVDPPPPPPPPPLPIAATVLVNAFAVRSEPYTRGGDTTVQVRLDAGTNIFIDHLEEGVEHDTRYKWGKNVLDINGTRIGDYIAIENVLTGQEFLDLNEGTLNPPKAVKYPTVKKAYGTRNFNSIQIDGSNSRQQTGVNFTFGLWMVEGNGAIIDESLKANGVTNALTAEELDKMNKPNWKNPDGSGEEPYKIHVLRVRVKNKRYGINQTILNGHEFMKRIKTYTANVPYLRVLWCFDDTFGQYPNLYFGDEQSYHDQPMSKTGNRYWNDEVWRRNLLPFGKAFIEAMRPYDDYILGYQTGNEFALNAPQNNGANLQSIEDYIGGQNEMATAFAVSCDRQHHIMTGQRTAHDIYQNAMSSEVFYKNLYEDSDLTCVNFHPYCHKPPITDLTPQSVIREWGFMLKDIEGAKAQGLPIIADEMGTYHEGYGFAQPQRDEVLKYSLEYLQWVCGVWCCMGWNQMLRSDIDRGYGDNERGLTSVKKDANNNPIAVVSTPGAVKVFNDHAVANYARG